MNTLENALAFATIAHKGQFRKSEKVIEYIEHPKRVVELLKLAGVTDLDTLISAMSHDILEDSNITFEQLEKEFGTKVATIVLECSDDKSLPKEERKLLQISHVKNISNEARLVKLADKIDNLGDIAVNSPKGWDRARKVAYFDWSKEVVDSGLRNINPLLDSLFDEIYKLKDTL